MREIVIFGTGKGGMHLFQEAKKLEKVRVISFLDNTRTGEIEKIPVCKPEEFMLFHENDKNNYEYYITAGAQKTVKIMLDFLLNNKIQDIYVLHDIAGKNQFSVISKGDWNSRWIKKVGINELKPTLHYFEVPITDQCNLNCRGCIFGCNSAQNKNQHVPTEQVVKDIHRMAELFFDVPWIRILGGEPLLHTGITEILKAARTAFPESEVDLCTNGIMIPNMSDEFMQLLVDLNVSVHISGYPPTEKIAERIEAKLHQYGLPYTFLHRPEFFKFYSIEPSHQMIENYNLCPTSGCWEVYRGKIMRCSATIAFEKLNKQFGTEYQLVENVDWFDLYESGLDAFQLKKALSHAAHICKYCDLNHIEEFEWHNGGIPELKDYVLEDVE
ncbi:MAG: radical SAM protein [Lachnospiraceae bacterium]|nr:radical SAM protein [Lachnospiraceae bacterium]